MIDEADTARAVLDFWFGDRADDAASLAARHARWFGVDPAFDGEIRARYAGLLAQAAGGGLRRWKLTPRGTLALILIFDQFPRNMYRNLPQAFDFDQRAQALSRDGIAMGSDGELTLVERVFFYLPLVHAEDREAQDRSVACFERLHADADTVTREFTARCLEHAREHRDIVHRHGRFPHRNLVLGRNSTADELAWLSAHRGTYGQG